MRPSAAALLIALTACAPRLLPRAPGASAALEAWALRSAGPSVLEVLAGATQGTAFVCIAPGVACTARHVVGERSAVRVRAPTGAVAEAPVLARHPLDDVALLDVRALRGAAPLPVSMLDPPPAGLVACRVGRPPSPARAFVRCDPLGGVVLETTRTPGAVLARLVHLGIGFKGDSGAPLLDPATGLVVGMHVSEANGSARAATSVALLDTFAQVERKEAWARACAPAQGGGLGALVLRLRCPGLTASQKGEAFRRLGQALLELGRRAEALSAFEELLSLDPDRGEAWLWRALVFPGSAHALDDAALAFRLSPGLREDGALRRAFPQRHREAARSLRDAVAPPGARLATLVGAGACDACPSFCEKARRDASVRLWAVDDANHPAALSWLQRRLGGSDGSTPLVAVDGRVASGCGKLWP